MAPIQHQLTPQNASIPHSTLKERQDTPDRWEDALAVEKLNLLYNQSSAGFLATIANAGILIFLLWGIASPVGLGAWFAYVVSVTLARFFLVSWYHQQPRAPEETAQWRARFLVGAGAAGLGWGLASVCFLPTDSLVYQAFFVLLMGGLGAGGLAVLGADLQAFYLFLVPTLLLPPVRLFLQPAPMSIAMGLLCLLLTGVLIVAARHYNLSIVTSLRLRFENLDLVEQLVEMQARAEAANVAKSAFLANMSHELRTPLHGILSFARFGLKKVTTAKPEKLLSYFQQIEGSGETLLSLLNDLLDLAKLESGKMNFVFQKTPLTPLVYLVADEFQPQIAERQLSLVCQVSDEPDESISAVLDTARFQQVIRNLFSNAMKFSPEGSTITVQLERQKEAVRISVQDQGPGIPDGECEAVFEKFIQSSQTKTNAGGTGLGLAICREIVAAHEGKIWVENAPEGGAIFFVELPVSERVAHLITPAEETPQIAA